MSIFELTPAILDHADYPHDPGTLYDCAACEELMAAEQDDDEPATLDYAGARALAARWHGGRDVHLTGLSTGTDWSNGGLADELDALLAEHPEDPELLALRAWVDGAWISSVWSAFGHEFTGSGDDDAVMCLTCGAEYLLVHNDPYDPHHGAYVDRWHAEPADCTGDRDMAHGYGECLTCEGEGCEHCEHACPCLLCTG